MVEEWQKLKKSLLHFERYNQNCIMDVINNNYLICW